MNFRSIVRIAVVCSIGSSLGGCGESGGSGETTQTTTSPGGSGDTVPTDGSEADPGASGGGNNTTTPAGNTNPTTTNPDDGSGGMDSGDTPNPGFCPETQPEAGAECMVGFPAACNYADVGCVCGDGVWACYSESDCPDAAPADGATCDLNGMACTYDDLGCTCDTTDGWTCNSACPDMQPTDGMSCRRSANQSCNYAAGALAPGFMSMPDTTCACTDGAFVCFSDANCPAEAPTTGAACEFPTLDCEFTGSNCRCDADGTWQCQTDCPETLPADGASCERPEQAACRYDDMGAAVQGFGGMGGGDVASTCTCTDLAFVCIGQEDCPAEAPATGGECANLTGLACDYEGSSCNCGEEGWTCQTECPAAPPADGASCERPEQAACRYAEGELLAGGGGFGGGGGAQADTSCACVENAFDCFSPEDCPTTLPGEDEACTVTGVLCVVAGQNCTCSGRTDTWTCVVPSEAGAPAMTEAPETTAEATSAVVTSDAPPVSADGGAQ